MHEVLYQGEYVDKDWLNVWLNTPEGKRIHEEEKAKEKAAAEEERKKQQQLQKQKQAENKSREKKVQEYFLKFRQEYGPDASISDELAHMLWQRAHNAVDAESRDEEYRKQREEERRQMEESRKKRQKEREQILEVITKARRRKELEKTILQEYDNGRILRLDDQTHGRLAKITKPGETKLDTINRLLDAATAAAAK